MEKKKRKKRSEIEKKNMEKEKIRMEETKNIKDVPSKKQKNENNKILLLIFIIIGVIFIAFFSLYFFIESKKSFEYQGVKFTKIQEGSLTFYNTQIPIYAENGEQISVYNFYLRTHPKKLANLDFNGTIELLKFVALNYSSDIDCSGYGIIALTNIINLYNLIEAKVIVDKNATCEPDGKYMFLNIQKTDENKIEKIGPNCYNLKVNGCNVFPTTERFMLDTFIKIKEKDIRVISHGYSAD
ncbi:MAG: hypothetical protein ABIB47_00175 [Candidatus Woesearchaeota archaeon]